MAGTAGLPAADAPAHGLIEQLLQRAGALRAAADGPSAVATADALFRALATELSRSFGPYGYHALLVRALAQTRAEHPALAGVQVRSVPEPSLDGLAEGVQRHGPAAATAGVAAVLTTLVALLGRVIGDELAQRLVAQALPTPAPADGDAGATILETVP